MEWNIIDVFSDQSSEQKNSGKNIAYIGQEKGNLRFQKQCRILIHFSKKWKLGRKLSFSPLYSQKKCQK